jgi:Fe-S cluster assembly scaffold protein SufB
VSHHALLPDQASRTESLPQLEVVENDVECSHASIIDTLRPEDLYYLQSRGIGPEEARRLLLSSFIRAALKRMPSAAYKPRRLKLIRDLIAGACGIRVNEADWSGTGHD